MDTRRLVEDLGGLHVDFQHEEIKRIDVVRRTVPHKERLERLKQEVRDAPDTDRPRMRYEVEYREGAYASYKPGIDDERLDALVDFSVAGSRVIEIGGGPATIAERGRVKICADIVGHPRLEAAGITFVQSDICDPTSVEKICTASGTNGNVPTLTILSYCLDRVPNQRRALAHFAQIIGKTRGVGLITVLLPARPNSPGFQEDVVYTESGMHDWVTHGRSAQDDYRRIVTVCQSNGIVFIRGGKTTHYGSSLDGYEELACYVLVFRHG